MITVPPSPRGGSGLPGGSFHWAAGISNQGCKGGAGGDGGWSMIQAGRSSGSFLHSTAHLMAASAVAVLVCNNGRQGPALQLTCCGYR